ncbi:adhesion G protein-coupled receptor E5 isoform X2 [Cervus elaphus]|uniref:adhesion G protein-coupled receptor E5 isoform X2 n=1 Tax=Cervus canadensis TaxID=1574408 RepID=UPI001C9E3FBA|nr:adhesion G protein-coupled receptor E5 isoform X2 [Cervus canadensis]XP_043767157.1 adhesion G protein-coupled receptor E5 isoform X2 [Cervus elaphus]
MCVRGAPGSVFSLHFPVGFQLPRQFRGGPWARGCSPAPLYKGQAGLGKACTAAQLGDRNSPAPSSAGPAAARTMGGPHGGPFLLFHVLCFLLTLSEVGSQNSKACALRCPPKSSCVNGNACRCDPGFISSSGEIFTDPLESCDDINECGPPSPMYCGSSADCQNTEGGYHCTCSPGFEPTSGATIFQNESENTCQDVNECTSGKKPCHNSTHCLNIVGSYECRCRPGWKPVAGSPNGPNNTVCEDVDECSSGKHQCDNSTVCVNTVGSYTCHCRQGWMPKPGFRDKQMTTICKEITFPAWTAPPGIKSRSLSAFFERVQKMSRDFKPAMAETSMQNLVESVDDLLKNSGDLELLDQSSKHITVTHLLSGLERILRTLAKAISKGSFTYCSLDGTELSLVVQEQGKGNVTVGQSHARMLLDWAVAAAAGESGPSVVGILSSRNMEKLLANASLELDLEKLKETYESPVRGAKVTLLSAVSSVFVSNTDTEKLDSNVSFAFTLYKQPELKPRQELICAFWKKDSNGNGFWATSGCWKMGSGNGSITCQCSHLSSFAILMAHYDVEDPKLALITKVGLALSLVCLLLCILTFLLVRPIQGSRTTVHLHLCICLFVGSAIFLAGIENEGGEVGTRCRLVAVLLHYCFLAAFCWMSLEGVELYFLVVRVFQGQDLRKRWLCLIGYGVPLIIVGISAGAYSKGYGREKFCWLNFEGGFLWSFVGPVTFIVLGNAIIFVITVWKLTQKFSEINPDIKKLKKIRVLTITAIAQLFVLGCTWVFGLLLFDPESWVLSYIFSILNCLQGFFLFVLYCLLNKKVREEYRKWACMVAGNKYSEFATTTSGSGFSHNQTQALRPSESGM